MDIRSVLSAILLSGALLFLGACSAREPTSFGSTLGVGRQGSTFDLGSIGSTFSLASIGIALGLESRDLSYCPRGPAPDYAVTTFLPEPKIDKSMSLDQIGRLMNVDYRHMALGATESREVVFALMNVKVAQSPEGGVCAYPTRLAFTLGLTARRIHVASDFVGSEPCVYTEVLGHEKRHVALDDALMRAAAKALRAGAAKGLADLYGVWGRNEAAARENLQRRLEADEARVRTEIERKRIDAQADEIDTAAERHRLVAACNGRLSRLYPGYM